MQFATSATLWQCAVLRILYVRCIFHIPSNLYRREKQKSAQAELKTSCRRHLRDAIITGFFLMQLTILQNSQMDAVRGE